MTQVFFLFYGIKHDTSNQLYQRAVCVPLQAEIRDARDTDTHPPSDVPETLAEPVFNHHGCTRWVVMYQLEEVYTSFKKDTQFAQFAVMCTMNPYVLFKSTSFQVPCHLSTDSLLSLLLIKLRYKTQKTAKTSHITNYTVFKPHIVHCFGFIHCIVQSQPSSNSSFEK